MTAVRSRRSASRSGAIIQSSIDQQVELRESCQKAGVETVAATDGRSCSRCGMPT